MKEYEYSFYVTSLEPYIKYCENNSYVKISDLRQIRTIYRKYDKTIARITKSIKDEIEIKELDFKEDLITESDLIERKESLPIKFEDEKAILSVLEFLEYKEDNTLDRNRIVYKKGNVKFEFDIYKIPYDAYVVAIEGEKNEVDEVFLALKEINGLYKIK